jgi:hypothetical protein
LAFLSFGQSRYPNCMVVKIIIYNHIFVKTVIFLKYFLASAILPKLQPECI